MSILKDSFIQYIIKFLKSKIEAKQDKLVSGTNIKTINGTSLLGSGDVSIEGGGNFDSSGTYPNLTAGKATKLATPRKIGITGGAIGTATNFDGSGDINIPVMSLNDTHLVYKKLSDINTEAPYLTLIDAVSGQFTANRLAFKKPENILIEYSNDNGESWNISNCTDADKVNLVSGIGAYLYLGDKPTGQTNQDKLRITILAGKNIDFYSSWQRLYIHLSTNGAYAKGEHGLWCTYEYSLNKTPDVWVSKGEWYMNGWSGWNKLSAAISAFGYKSNVNHPYAIRLTFRFEGHASGYENTTRACIRNIELRGDTVYSNYTGCKLPETNHMYDYDWQKNVTFPAAITATKHITKNGTANQVVLGNGTLKALSEISPITDADAEILLDNHIHSINVNANGNNVNISVIESSKNGNTWETEDNDITIPLATTTSAGLMSKEDKAKLDDLSVIEIKYTLTEYEYGNHEIVNLYNIVYAISNRLYNNGWLYNDDKSYDVVVKGWVDNRYNAITYANFNVRLLTTQDGHSLGINGYVDVAQITETNENADCPLWVGYICGKYHIEDDGMAFYAPENPNFIVEA